MCRSSGRTVSGGFVSQYACQTPILQQAAGGCEETWPLAEVRLTLNGDEVSTRCLIAPGGPAIIGAVALESLLLGVDPIAKRLIPVKGFVG